MGSVTTIARQRPQFMARVVQSFETLHGRSLYFERLKDWTRLPSKEHLRWQQTRKLLDYRESSYAILRVPCPYSKCNPPLRDSFLFLNTLKLLACTQSVDNLFHTLIIVLWENEYFLTSNLLFSFTSMELCPLVILLSLILKKYDMVYVLCCTTPVVFILWGSAL